MELVALGGRHHGCHGHLEVFRAVIDRRRLTPGAELAPGAFDGAVHECEQVHEADPGQVRDHDRCSDRDHLGTGERATDGEIH